MTLGIYIFLLVLASFLAYICGYNRGSDATYKAGQEEIEKLRKIKVEEWLYPDRAVLDQPLSEE